MTLREIMETSDCDLDSPVFAGDGNSPVIGVEMVRWNRKDKEFAGNDSLQNGVYLIVREGEQ